MKDLCIITDFDGTVTEKDTLYNFFEQYASKGWLEVEDMWVKNKISSKECLQREFDLVPSLSENLIDEFLNTVTIDSGFKSFCEFLNKQKIDIYIVSDGVDYFIEKVLQKYGINDMKLYSNHGEFKNGKFVLSFPNENAKCINDSGTCKCAILSQLKKEYNKVLYFGDGISDCCVADKADILFAKSDLLSYCKEKGIKCIPFETFEDADLTYNNPVRI